MKAWNRQFLMSLAAMFALSILSVTAQETTESRPSKRIYKDTEANDVLSLRLSYMGVLVAHPGGRVGVDYPLFSSIKEKTKRSGKVKNISRQWFSALEVGAYYHQRYHTALLSNLAFGYRRTATKGFMLEAAAGMGYAQTWMGSPTYTVMDDGSVNEVKGAGNGYLFPSFAWGVGQDFYKKKGSPFSWRVRSLMLFYAPYNSGFNMNWALELGVGWRIVPNPFKKGNK